MITLPSGMILFSLLFSIAFGGLSGFTHIFVWRVFSILFKVVKKNEKKPYHLKLQHDLIFNIFDFLYVFFVGMVYITFNYVLIDGVFELYSFVMLIMSFICGERIFSFIFKNNR